LITESPDRADAIPEPQSAYLSALVDRIKDYRNRDVYELADGPIWRQWFDDTVATWNDMGWFPPPTVFTPQSFKVTNVGTGGAIGATPLLALTSGNPEGAAAAAFTIPLASALGYGIGTERDKHNFLQPMSERFEKEGTDLYDAIGGLDELLAFHRFGEALPEATLPDVYDADVHEFRADGLKNAVVMHEEDGEYVPNDVEVKRRLIFLTGPNSGGKTTLGKSMLQAQVLAQNGCYIPAT
ncbi:MAG: hypothetical protein ABEI52_08780, partial [Halobacteriaceae archaeon]